MPPPELDALTGLPGQQLFVAELESELARARRLGSSITVLLVDVGDFPHVSNSLGQLQGDEVLRRLSERLETLACPTGAVAHLGGERFAVVLRESTLEDAEHLALRLELALRVRPLRPPLRIRVTHGAAELADDDDPPGLFRRAERGLMVRRAAKCTEQPVPPATHDVQPSSGPAGRPVLRLLPGGGETSG